MRERDSQWRDHDAILAGRLLASAGARRGRRSAPTPREFSRAASLERLFELLARSFGPDSERMVLLGLDGNARVVETIIVEGTEGTVPIERRGLLRRIAASSAQSVLFAHNHPSGIAKPSEADLDVTRALAQGCRTLGMQLIDHVIYAERGCCSFRARGIL